MPGCSSARLAVIARWPRRMKTGAAKRAWTGFAWEWIGAGHTNLCALLQNHCFCEQLFSAPMASKPHTCMGLMRRSKSVATWSSIAVLARWLYVLLRGRGWEVGRYWACCVACPAPGPSSSGPHVPMAAESWLERCCTYIPGPDRRTPKMAF